MTAKLLPFKPHHVHLMEFKVDWSRLELEQLDKEMQIKEAITIVVGDLPIGVLVLAYNDYFYEWEISFLVHEPARKQPRKLIAGFKAVFDKGFDDSSLSHAIAIVKSDEPARGRFLSYLGLQYRERELNYYGKNEDADVYYFPRHDSLAT